MRIKDKLAVAYTGIGLTILYFVVVAAYFLTESSLVFRCWEVMIMISASVILIVLISILENADESRKTLKAAAIAFMTCTVVITSTAHYASVISRNEITAEFHQNDPLAWGLFMGLAFILTSMALPSKNSKLKTIKYTTMICGCLCLLGLIGPMSNITALWFVAVAGYGIGTPVICVQLISFYRGQSLKEE